MKMLLSCALIGFLAATAQAEGPEVYGPVLPAPDEAPGYPTPAPEYAPGQPYEELPLPEGPQYGPPPGPRPGLRIEMEFGVPHGYNAEGPPPVLYKRVVVKDRDKIHPRAVPKLIPILVDIRHFDHFDVECVLVEVCVPPRRCTKFDRDRGGFKLELEYGDDYEIDIRSKNGVITVDYDN